MSNDLLIIGPSLQLHGIGGVTIHVQRLRDYLEINGIKYIFKDYRTNSLLKLLKAIKKADIIHYHISNPIYQFILVLSGSLMGKKTVVTLHGNYGRFGNLKNWLVRRTIKTATIPILINKKSYGICKQFNGNAKFISAFIPPQKEECLQKDILDIIEKLHNEKKKIISTNAYNVSIDKSGNDIYGIDFLVQFFKDNNDISLFVSDPSGNYHKLYSNLKSDSVFFIDYPHSYFELLKHIDYFVRNTSTDGDALSVKEALYLGVPTLCTDVVDRPQGVRLFKYCDKVSFEKAMNSPVEEKTSIENGAEKIIEVYKSILL